MNDRKRDWQCPWVMLKNPNCLRKWWNMFLVLLGETELIFSVICHGGEFTVVLWKKTFSASSAVRCSLTVTPEAWQCLLRGFLCWLSLWFFLLPWKHHFCFHCCFGSSCRAGRSLLLHRWETEMIFSPVLRLKISVSAYICHTSLRETLHSDTWVWMQSMKGAASVSFSLYVFLSNTEGRNALKSGWAYDQTIISSQGLLCN